MLAILSRLAAGLALFTMLPTGLAQERLQDAPSVVAAESAFAERVGPDSGFGLVLTASADGKGSLEMCGCGRMPLGGLPRRVGYERAVLAITGGQAALVRVDAGAAFDDTVDTGRNEVIPHIRNEWVLRGYHAKDFAAINVAPSDLGYLSQMNVPADRESRVERFPMLDRVISANVVPASDAVVRFQPFVIRAVDSPRLGSKALRVGIVGVCQPPEKPGKVLHGYRIEDPVVVLRTVLPELRKKADVVVLLVYGPMGAAREIASAVQGIDVVLAAKSILPDAEAAGRVGNTHVVPVIIQARSLTEVRGSVSPTGGWTFTPRSTVLDSVIPNDPETLDMVYGARVDFIR